MSDPKLGLIHFRVKELAHLHGGATARALPRKDGAVLHRLRPGDDFWGLPIVGDSVMVEGFGHTAIWIQNDQMWCVSLVFLEQVKE